MALSADHPIIPFGISQFHNQAQRQKIVVGHWTIKLAIRTARSNKSFQSLVFVKKLWWATGQSNLAYERLATKKAKFGFRTHTAIFWPMQQSSILSAKFDFPIIIITIIFNISSAQISIWIWSNAVARQNFSLLATAHDCVWVWVSQFVPAPHP